MKRFPLFLFISLCIPENFSTIKVLSKAENFCSSITEKKLVEEVLDSEVSVSVEQTLELNKKIKADFLSKNETKYFAFSSLESQICRLNYSGSNATIRLFYKNLISDKNYLTRINNANADLNLFYLDANTDYIFEITNTAQNQNSFSLEIKKCTLTNLSNHEKYILCQSKDSDSSLGYHYTIQSFDISSSSSVLTESKVVSNGSSVVYNSLLEETNYTFGIENDNRRLVSDPTYSYYSSIAKMSGDLKYDGAVQSSLSTGGTGTFVSENVILSSAHLFFNERKYSGRTLSTLTCNVNFKPGYMPPNHYFCGNYEVQKTYLPISFVIYRSDTQSGKSVSAIYDWSISIAKQTMSDIKVHSYMGIAHFDNANFTMAQSAGFPSLKNEDGRFVNNSLWTNYPLYHSLELVDEFSKKYIRSDDLVISEGNSGGPIFHQTTSVINGVPTTNCYLIGIISNSVHSGNRFISANAYTINHFIVNLYKEVAYA